jgi:hypothetical protein
MSVIYIFKKPELLWSPCFNYSSWDGCPRKQEAVRKIRPAVEEGRRTVARWDCSNQPGPAQHQNHLLTENVECHRKDLMGKSLMGIFYKFI